MANNTPDTKPLLLTPQQAAEALAISPRKLWGMTDSGEIPHLYIGRCKRYPLADLQRWLTRNAGAIYKGNGVRMGSSTPTKPALLLAPQQAAVTLAISPRKLWGMTDSGEMPPLRVGRCVRYPLDDLQRWIDAQKEGGDDR